MDVKLLTSTHLHLPSRPPVHTPSEQAISEPSFELGILFSQSHASPQDEYPLSMHWLPRTEIGFRGDTERGFVDWRSRGSHVRSQLRQLSIDTRVVLELWSPQLWWEPVDELHNWSGFFDRLHFEEFSHCNKWNTILNSMQEQMF